MTEEELKNSLKQMQAMQIQLSLLEENAKLNGKETRQYNKEKMKLLILQGALNILNCNERFVIKSHLIYHNTWLTTAELFSKEYGRNNERSDRTLKRLQSKALQKMLIFINSSPLREYFDETS